MRTVTAVEERTYDGQVAQVIPAGAEGIIRRTWPDGSHWAELVIAPRTEEYGDDDDDDDGGLVEVTLAEGQYEVIPSLCQNWTLHPRIPFATLIAVAASYLAPGANEPGSLQQRARQENDEEMRIFKAQLREAIISLHLVPRDELSRYVQDDDGSVEAFLKRLWLDLYGDEPVTEPEQPHCDETGQ